MSDPPSIEHIEQTPGVLGGKPRIKGKRIAVVHIKQMHIDGEMSMQEIREAFDLSPAEFHAAMAYYYDHQKEIDAHEAVANAEVEKLLERYPSKVEEKLRRRNAG